MSHTNSDDVRINGTILHSGTASTAQIELGVFDEKNLDPYFKMTMSGSAKVHNDDHFNLEVGQKLALGRALVTLGNKLIRQANKALAADIHNREHAKKAHARRKLWQKKKTEERLLRRISKEIEDKKKADAESVSEQYFTTKSANGNGTTVAESNPASEAVRVRVIDG